MTGKKVFQVKRLTTEKIPWGVDLTGVSRVLVFAVPRAKCAFYELCFILPHLAQVHHSLSIKFPQV